MGVAVRKTPLFLRSYQYTKFFSLDSNKNMSSCRSSKLRRASRASSSGLPVCAAISVSRLFREESSASYASRCCSRNASRSCRENGNLPSRGGNCRSEEHTSELQSHSDLVCRLLLEKKKNDNAARLALP